MFKSRPVLLGLATLGLLSLSACRATSEPILMKWSEPQFAGIPDAAKLGELSGLTRSNANPGVFWAINDGDNPAEIIAIDGQARTKAWFTLEGARNIDWEDIANYRDQGRNFLAIADTGDNGGLRTDLFLHIVEEPTPLTQNGQVAIVRTIRFQWPDGARDTEAMLADEKRRQFLLISKKRVPAELFALPFNAKDGDKPKLLATLEGIAQPDEKTMNAKGDYGRYRSQITGADISPDGQWLAVLNYQQITFFSLGPQDLPKRLQPMQIITLPWLPQAEGIAFSGDGNSVYVGSEQAPTPIIRYDRISD
ncbi:MAG TPA: hypothetical protein VN248_01930 [Arenimonas sp.]|nr:hypothetical protein [Arenimonas sp.]